MPLRVSRGRILAWLSLIAATLVVLNLAAHLFTAVTGHDHVRGLIPLLDLDLESNLPSLYGAFLLLAAAALVALQAAILHARRGPDRQLWTGLALVLLAMAFDEVASAHELLTEPMRELLGAGRPRILHFAWIVPGALAAAAFAWLYRGFFARLPDPVRPRVLLAALVYLGGAVGVEMVGGYYAAANSTGTFVYKALLVGLEEGLEMAGVILFIGAMLLQLALTAPALSVQFAASAPARRDRRFPARAAMPAADAPASGHPAPPSAAWAAQAGAIPRTGARKA